MPNQFETKSLPELLDVFAPDGSEIRVLLSLKGGSLAHGSLPPGATSSAVRHRSVDEIWYVLSGQADLWRSQNGYETVERIAAATAVTIPVGTSFQFRTAGEEAFVFIMCTMPPWPGADEAEPTEGKWS